jgi:hypothetical protein
MFTKDWRFITYTNGSPETIFDLIVPNSGHGATRLFRFRKDRRCNTVSRASRDDLG